MSSRGSASGSRGKHFRALSPSIFIFLMTGTVISNTRVELNTWKTQSLLNSTVFVNNETSFPWPVSSLRLSKAWEVALWAHGVGFFFFFSSGGFELTLVYCFGGTLKKHALGLGAQTAVCLPSMQESLGLFLSAARAGAHSIPRKVGKWRQEKFKVILGQIAPLRYLRHCFSNNKIAWL